MPPSAIIMARFIALIDFDCIVPTRIDIFNIAMLNQYNLTLPGATWRQFK